MDIYQHFRTDEHEFIDQVLSWKEEVERTYQRKLTNFLDPRQQQILSMVIGSSNDELQVKQYGGGMYAERMRAVIAPYYEEVVKEDFQLSLVQANYNDKFISITHRDIMGAFLGLGLKREVLGDIYEEDGVVQIVVTAEISPYVLSQLTGIKHAKLTFTEKPLSQIIEKEQRWLESNKTVSSLRLDNIIKEIYSISRNAASEFIKKKLVKVNYKTVDDPKYVLKEEDMISLRGRGRSRLIRINGRTKKDKIKMTIAILVE